MTKIGSHTSRRCAVVTGAAGFVGANLVQRLLREGHDVHMVVHPASDLWRLEGFGSDAAVHRVDLTDADAVTHLVSAVRPDWVFHAAAHGAYPSQTDLRLMIATNLVGTVNLLEAAMHTGFEAFVHAGTSSEYGTKNQAPSEDEVIEPNSHYAVTKAAATLYCRHTARTHGAAIRVLRLYSVYGPWEEPTRLMPQLVVHGSRGGWPRLADPATARDFVYTDDVVDAFLAAATAPDQDPGAIYNIGTGVQTTLGEVVQVAAAELSIATEPRWGSMADRSWDTATWVADPASALKRLGWAARHDVASGLRAFVPWLCDTPCRRERYEQAGG